MKTRARSSRTGPALAAGLAGLAWCCWAIGGRKLNPVNLDWVLVGDWSQHVTGWLLFRNEPWHFPLGRLTNALYPVGTAIGFSDSNAVVSVLLKPFSGVLPADFHFIGLWLGLCFALQGVAGVMITSLVTRDRLQQFLGGTLFALSPVLVFRVYHDTLCAHWILLLLIYLALEPLVAAPDGRTGVRPHLSAALVWLAAGIHPYLTAMSLVLAVSGFVVAWRARRMTAGGLAAWTVATTAGTIAVFWIFGYFGNPSFGVSGFGDFSADLLTLVNSEGRSRVLPALPTVHEAWNEGFGYLGLGGLALGALAIVAAVRVRAGWRRAWPLIAAAVLMALYAASPILHAGGRVVLSMRGAYAPFASLTAIFRTSGRFVWPLHYLALAAGVWGAVRLAKSRPLIATTILAGAVALQLADTDTSRLKFDEPPPPLPAAAWAAAAGHFSHLALVPMWAPDACNAEWNGAEVVQYNVMAYRLRLTTNSGLFARPAFTRLQAACVAQDQAIGAGTLDPRTIYVLLDHRPAGMIAARAVCGLHLEGHLVCVDPRADAAFRTYLAAHP